MQFKTIWIQNTLTADKKGIASTVTTENSAQKARTDYTYNGKGQVTKEKDYIDNSKRRCKCSVYCHHQLYE